MPNDTNEPKAPPPAAAGEPNAAAGEPSALAERKPEPANEDADL